MPTLHKENTALGMLEAMATHTHTRGTKESVSDGGKEMSSEGGFFSWNAG